MLSGRELLGTPGTSPFSQTQAYAHIQDIYIYTSLICFRISVHAKAKHHHSILSRRLVQVRREC